MEFTVSQLKYILALGALSEAGDVRIVDIARTLNIQRSSVFNMLNKLANAGIIEKKEDKTVVLTDNGKSTVNSLYKKVKQTALKMEECFDLDSGRAEECALLVLSFGDMDAV